MNWADHCDVDPQPPAGTCTTAAQTVTADSSTRVELADVVQTKPTLTVNTSADHDDGSCTVDDCALREAINAANAPPDTPRTMIQFDIPGASKTISPTSALPAVKAHETVIDARTQPGYDGRPLVILHGPNEHSMESGLLFFSNGLELRGGNDEVYGLAIINFTDAGVLIADNGGNTVAGNYIGTVDGTDAGNGTGIVIDPTSGGNMIGGTGVRNRNVISLNGDYGVEIDADDGLSSDGNVVSGNYIGLKADGSAAAFDGHIGGSGNYFGGILVDGSNNTIGGTTDAARNYISANDGIGITIDGSGNVVKGNTIGLPDASPGTEGDLTAPAGNAGDGVVVVESPDSGAPANAIGDPSDGGNVISGNKGNGVTVTAPSSDEPTAAAAAAAADPGTVIAGNLIGTDPTGTMPIGNTGSGINLDFAASVTVAGNTISGNGQNGVSSSNSSDDVFTANKIGTDSAGTALVANGSDGMDIEEDSASTIGGDAAGSGNVISGNNGDGIYLYFDGLGDGCRQLDRHGFGWNQSDYQPGQWHRDLLR